MPSPVPSESFFTGIHQDDRRDMRLVALITFSCALVFAIFTQHAWEDYYITFRTSKNLVHGHGLVFTPNEPVHTFTSPLGVLLPALTSAVTGGKSDQAALWLFRVISAIALGGASALVYATIRALRCSRLPAWGAGLVLAFEAKTIDFSTNGMETGVLLFFLAYALWALSRAEAAPWRHLGLAWAGIMWSRPDGFIYIGLLATGFGLFNCFSAPGLKLRQTATLLLRAAVVCTLLYLPWFVWAWSYYGSPIPHTIIAKGSLNPDRSILGFIQTFVTFPLNLWAGRTTLDGTLMPTYYQAGGWPAAIAYTARGAGALAAFAWLWPRLPATLRAASLTFHGAHAYLTYFPFFPFPWYFPATAILAAVVWGGLFSQLANIRPGARWLRLGTTAMAGWITLTMIGLSLVSAIQMRAKQRIVYSGNLQRIGEWLNQNAKPTDYVFMEPLGYIGYYSGLRTHDFPGLSSPSMVEARKGGNGWGRLLLTLSPEWAVLRESEADRIRRESPDLLKTYYLPVQEFDVRPQVAAARVPDSFMLNFDAHFTVYRRQIDRVGDNHVLGVQHHFGTNTPILQIDGVRVRMVHAPGTLGIRIPSGARRARIPFGYNPAAYTESEHRTDGGEFVVYWVDGASRHELARRHLDPARRPEDRELQYLEIELPVPATDRAKLLLHTRPGATMTSDWTCWGSVTFQ